MGKSIQALIHVHSLIIRINPFICDNREREREREKEKETDRQRKSEYNQSFTGHYRKINDYEAASINCQQKNKFPL